MRDRQTLRSRCPSSALELDRTTIAKITPGRKAGSSQTISSEDWWALFGGGSGEPFSSLMDSVFHFGLLPRSTGIVSAKRIQLPIRADDVRAAVTHTVLNDTQQSRTK